MKFIQITGFSIALILLILVFATKEMIFVPILSGVVAGLLVISKKNIIKNK